MLLLRLLAAGCVLLQGQPKGRLLRYDPNTKETHVLATVSCLILDLRCNNVRCVKAHAVSVHVMLFSALGV